MKLTLRQWRGLREMSQDELAEAIGVSRISVWSWEKGKVNPKAENLEQLKSVLGLKKTDHIIVPKS